MKQDKTALPALANIHRRDVLRLGGVAAAAAATTVLPYRSASAASSRLIRFAHSAPTTHGWNVWAVAFKKAIEAGSKGAFRVQIFPNAQMGNEHDIAQAVRLGSLDMGAFGVALMNWVPDMSITDAPFLWKSRAQAYAAFDGKFGDELKKRCLAKGFRLTGWTDLGFRCMTNNKKVIKTAADMHGLKMRVPNSKSYIAMMQALGATTVAVDLSELYLALRQGVADGQDTPPTVVESNKLYEVQKYVSKTNHVLTTAYVLINPKIYDSYSSEEKGFVNAASKVADDFLRKHTQKGEASAYGFLGKHGMTVTENVDRESFRKATSNVIADNPDLFKPDLVKLARATVA